MNHIFKVVFNKCKGVWVATSEHSKGRKKRKKIKKPIVRLTISTTVILTAGFSVSTIAADCSDTSLPYSGGASNGVYGCYNSGILQDVNNDGKIDAIDENNTANYKNKDQAFTSDTLFSLSNDVEWRPQTSGPGTPLPVDYVSASELLKRGALTITDANGNAVAIAPTIQDWDLNVQQGKKQVSWIKTDGSQGFADVYSVDNLLVDKSLDSSTGFTAQIITAQPTQPYVNLTLASISNGGKLDLVSDGNAVKDGFAIDWSPGQVKQSSLFIANDSGTINQAADTAIRVIFSYTDGVNNPADNTPVSGKFGPTKMLSGADILFQGTTYTINSKEALSAYNDALIAAIKDNTLTSSDYDSMFKKAFKNAQPEYTYTYDPSKIDYTDYFISPEMAAAVGRRAIFEANGSGVVNLNANVAAIGQTFARAYNAWAHDGGTVNNLGTVTVNHANTQNALIESGASFINKGTLNFLVNGTNWADQVSGSDSSYLNQGIISVSTSTKNNPTAIHPNTYYKTSRNIATEILNAASSLNTGRYYIGGRESASSVGTATGAHIKDAGSFTNAGSMVIGKDVAGNNINLKGGSAAETLYVDDAYNAISAYANNSGNNINIVNETSGTIDINSTAKNSVAINIGEDPALTNTSGSSFIPKNVTIENKGTINVNGSNSAGLKAAGAFTTANNDIITNSGTISVSGSGSSGIFSASGAEITNNGNVVVTGSDTLKNRVYGIRADNATVNLADNSHLTVLGSRTTGLYARTGGKINVNGGSIAVPQDTGAENQVVFWISGKNAEGVSSQITFSSPTDYALDNADSTLFRIDQGATYNGSSSNLKSVDVKGKGSNGYSIANKGTTFTSGGSTINVIGENATGINVNSGAGTDGKVRLSRDTQITVSGKGATIATVDGNSYDVLGNKTGQAGAKLITEATLSTGTGGQIAANAIGYKVINKGELQQNGTVNFSNASEATGVYIDGGTLVNNGAITSNGVGVDVYQTGANASTVNNASNISAVDGTAAIRLNNRAQLAVGGKGNIDGHNSADAIRVMSGANLTTNSAKISVDGSGSGIHFLNTATDASGSTFKLAGSGEITVSGNNAAGITLEGQNNAGQPTMSNANMDTRGSEKLVISVNDNGGNGIVTNTSGHVYSGTSVNINSAEGQSALVVKGGTRDIIQTGKLSSNSTSASVVDLTGISDPASAINFLNSGSILANGGAAALDASGHHGKVDFKNTETGNITGKVLLGDGSNTIQLDKNSVSSDVSTGAGNNIINVADSANLSGTLVAGDGLNTVNLSDNSKVNNLSLGAGNNSIRVINSASVSGTLSAGNGRNTVNLSNDSKVNNLNLGAGNNAINVADAANVLGSITAGNGLNTVNISDDSQINNLSLGGGNNIINVSNTARVSGEIAAGNGKNNITLKDGSQTKSLTAGNGGNSITIYGGTNNGTLSTGSGNDNYTLTGINTNNTTPAQSDNAFTRLNGGAGNDLLTATGASWYILKNTNNIQNFENLHITEGSTFEVNNVGLQLNNSGENTNVVQVDKESTYFINFDRAATDYRLTQNIKGDGVIKTNTNGHAFDFANASYTRNNFTGTLALGNGTFIVSGDNTAALTNATLQLDTLGAATLPKNQDTQVIGGLIFNNGSLTLLQDFIGSKEDALQSHMRVTTLDVSGAGTVHIIANGFDNDYNPQEQLKDLSRKSLLKQDEGNTLVTIVRATGSVIGKATDILVRLTDANGNVLPGAEDQQQAIRQAGKSVATGTYGIGSTTGERGDGLYAAYLLKQIDILKNSTVNLQTSQGDIINSLDLSARITGAGNIDINSYGDYLSLSNHNNDYTGITTVRNGKFVLEDDTVLGQEASHTRALNMLANTSVQFGRTTQYIGQLNSALNSMVGLNSGTVNIDNGGMVAGTITSDNTAVMNVKGGVLSITGANPGYHGTTNISSPATVNINYLTGVGTGPINLAGILNVVNAGAGNLANVISGLGNANVRSGSDVNLTGDNALFGGSFTIDGKSILRASEQKNIGSDGLTEVNNINNPSVPVLLATSPASSIHNDGKLYLTNDNTQTWTVNNIIDGKGDLIKAGSGTLTLTANSAKYTGQTWLTQGVLTAGETSKPVDMATSVLNIAKNTTFGGYGSLAGGVNNQGTFNVGGLDKASLSAPTTYRVKGDFNNSGTIMLGSATATGSTLNIGGNYLSNGGQLNLNTVLNKGLAETKTDRMYVGGNVVTAAGGATKIAVKNVGGKGAYTQPDAIKLVDVKGQSDNNAFVLARPAVIGVYEYRLNKGINDNSWYLSSFNPVYPPGENGGETNPRYVNPMVGGFAANQNALSLFNMTLHDRLGEPQYAESLRNDGDFAHSLWLRVVSSHQRYQAIDNQVNIKGHSSVAQLGHDIIHWSDNHNWRGRIGVMGGVGNQEMSSKSRHTGSSARANVDSAYSVGLYGTLYENAENPLGTYVDTWALYNWYRNTVGMSGYSDAKYHSRGYNLSVESGHTFVLKQSADAQKQWQLQPQAQLTYGGLTSDAASSDAGLNIDKTKSYSLESRLGARLTWIRKFNKEQHVQPFAELNWRHEFRDNTMTFNDRYEVNNRPPQNRYEMKVGMEGKSAKNVNGWANVSYSVGDEHYREPKAMIGIKYQW